MSNPEEFDLLQLENKQRGLPFDPNAREGLTGSEYWNDPQGQQSDSLRANQEAAERSARRQAMMRAHQAAQQARAAASGAGSGETIIPPEPRQPFEPLSDQLSTPRSVPPAPVPPAPVAPAPDPLAPTPPPEPPKSPFAPKPETLPSAPALPQTLEEKLQAAMDKAQVEILDANTGSEPVKPPTVTNPVAHDIKHSGTFEMRLEDAAHHSDIIHQAGTSKVIEHVEIGVTALEDYFKRTCGRFDG